MLVIAVSCICLAAGGVSAQPAPDDFLEASRQALSQQESPTTKALRDQANTITQSAANDPAIAALTTQGVTLQQSAVDATRPISTIAPAAGRRFRLFISQAVPAGTLDGALAVASRTPNLSVVFRGAKPDQPLSDVVALVRTRIQALPKDSPPPAVEIDPPRFGQAHIGSVPALVAYDDDVPVAWLRGSLSVSAVETALQEGRRGDLGKEGPTYDVIERDFAEVMKARAAQIDVATLRDRAMAAFWQKQVFVPLPTARDARERTVDPSIEVTADIVTPAGQVIARAGERVNPLTRMPFTQRLVVINANDPAQVAVVKPFMDAHGRRVTLMTTEVDRTQGWSQLNARSAALGAEVHLLTAPIADRFHIERVPTVIEADGDHFVVRELAVPLSAQEGADAGLEQASR